MRRWQRAAALIGLLLLGGLTALAQSLRDDAFGELNRGRLREGGRLLRQALEQAADDKDRAFLLLNIAQVEVNLGRYRECLQAASEALAIYEAAGDDPGIAETHLRIGNAHDELAQYDDALRHYASALEGFHTMEDRYGEARTLSSLGTSYRFLRDPQRALQFAVRARALFRELDQPGWLSVELRHLGSILEELDRLPEAREQYHSALELLGDDGRQWERAAVLLHLGRLQAREGSIDVAVSSFREGLEAARRSQNRWAEAQIRVELARLHGEIGQPLVGLPLAQAGADALRAMGAVDLEWEARFVRATLLERAGRVDAAAEGYRQALAQLESVRESVGVPLLRTRYTPKARPVYEALLQIEAARSLGDDGRTREERTFEIAEDNRARTFLDMLLESRAATATATAESDAHRRERTLRGKIEALRVRLTRFADTVADRDAVESELIQAESQHATLVLDLSRADPRYDAAGAPKYSLEEAADLLGRDADLLAYYLGERRSFCWHLTADGLKMFDLPPRAQIENLVLFFRSLVRHRNDPEALALTSRRLYDLLLAPIDIALDADRPLVVVPDGALFLLPFEALLLPEETGYLVQKRSVSYAPSTAVLVELRETPRTADSGDLLAFGDPLVGDDAALPPLQFAGSEIRRVTGLFGRRAQTYARDAATESAFRELTSRPSAVVHVASHGVLDGAHPERSGLVFSPEPAGPGDGFLSLFEVLGLRASTDLVVLSGCDTARGELLRGEGVLGLTSGFLFAGSRAVVSSLWKVDDRSTGLLMAYFYGHLGRGLSAAEALTRAKREWIERHESDPFHWAGFVLMGDGETTISLRSKRGSVPYVVLTLGLALLGVALVLGRHRRQLRPDTRD